MYVRQAAKSGGLSLIWSKADCFHAARSKSQRQASRLGGLSDNAVALRLCGWPFLLFLLSRLIHTDDAAAAFEQHRVAPDAVKLRDPFAYAQLTKTMLEMQRDA